MRKTDQLDFINSNVDFAIVTMQQLQLEMRYFMAAVILILLVMIVKR